MMTLRPEQKRGYEIREGLAGAGARLDDERLRPASAKPTAAAIAACSGRKEYPGSARASGPVNQDIFIIGVDAREPTWIRPRSLHGLREIAQTRSIWA